MTSQKNLEIKGNLRINPFAELLSEICEIKPSGSFRLSFETNKIIVYLSDGKVVFAISNARRHRLFEMLLRENKILQNQITGFPNFTNDLELGAHLKDKNIVSEAEINRLFSAQIEEILKIVFEWSSGEWIFSPHSRIKENIRFEADAPRLLLEYARNLPDETIAQRLKNPHETFGAKPFVSENAGLLPPEAFVLSRFEKSFLPVQEIKNLSGLPDSSTLRIIYTLWLGGFLFRQNWQAAFSERKIAELTSARLSLKKEFNEPSEKENPVKFAPIAPPIIAVPVSPEAVSNNLKKAELSLDAYLGQVENAANLYEILNVAPETDSMEIKLRYFALAKQFHPDMFHQEKNSVLLQRIQSAFAQTAQAYDTLKDAESRKVYDYKLNKNLVGQKPKNVSDGASVNSGNPQDEFAGESFEQGFSLLMENEYEEALPLLGRAAQLAPNNAKYHAYYGKALSADETQRYKADIELQTAIRLEPQNITYRLISAEFYIQYGLFKRAEGELKRLLTIFPNQPEALALLGSLAKK
ncbi:MAG: J domain-containing protein [Pyrinomonadaceae bacterium]